MRDNDYNEHDFLNIILQVTVVCRLVSHRIPSFGFVVEETDKAGPILDAACKKASLPYKHFDDVKVTIFHGA